jgi:hypothetical protein
LQVREVYEETSLHVEAKHLIAVDEVSNIEDTIYNDDYTAELEYKHIIRSVGLYYRCDIMWDEKLDPNWEDLCGGLVKYANFVDEEKFKTLKTKEFSGMSFDQIKEMKGVDMGFVRKHD